MAVSPKIGYADTTVAMITRNEQGAIRKVVADIKRFAAGAQILIVDSSTDQTAEIAERLGVKVIKQFPPQGYGPAMARALNSPKTPYVVTLDCDDTYPAEYIPTIINYLRSGYDLVDTSRVWRRPPAMPWTHYLANRFFALSAWALTGVHASDLHSGMRGYRRSIFNQVSFDTKPSALPVELLLKPVKLGYKYIELPIEYRLRLGDSTLDRWNSTKWTFIRVWRVRQLKASTRSKGRINGKS